MAFSYVYIAVLLTFFGSKSLASHYRGGTISWKHLGLSGSDHKIEINFRLGWRRDYFSNDICDDTVIAAQTPIHEGGTWVIEGTTKYTPQNQTTKIICTVYELENNWSYGYNSFTALVSSIQPFSISYTGSAWIGGTEFGSTGWAMTAGNIDLDVRSDTQAINNPPRTFSTPIVRLTLGCPEDIVIRYQDDDNDRVTCRYAISGATPDECATACNGPTSTGYSNFILNQTTCRISYNGAGTAGLVAVTLVLEDHPRTNIVLGSTRSVSTSDYLSQIPLQFIVEIKPGTACNVIPTYPNDTIPGNETIPVPTKGGLNRKVCAYSSSNSTIITQFVVLGPVGLKVDVAARIKDNLFCSNLTWRPTPDQNGTYDVCYYASETGGNAGKQICFKAKAISVVNPCTINNGGCSDICTFSGTDQTCSCSIPCWSLDLDGKTCIPDMDISCDGNEMNISMDGCASTKVLVAGDSFSHIIQSQCRSTKIGNLHTLTWKAATCGITYQVYPEHVDYEGRMWVWHSFDTSNSVITRGEYRLVRVKCALPALANVTEAFVPELPFNRESFPVNLSIEGSGAFSFYFEFYRSSEYKSLIPPSEYPLTVSVNDRMFFALGAVAQSGLEIFTEECEATASSPDQNGPPLKYTFLKDGCFLDSTLVRYTSRTAMEDRISMLAFDFLNKLTSPRERAEITIQCKVQICDAANNASRCTRGCLSPKRLARSVIGRYVRDVDHHDGHDEPQTLENLSPMPVVQASFILVSDAGDATRINAHFSRGVEFEKIGRNA